MIWYGEFPELRRFIVGVSNEGQHRGANVMTRYEEIILYFTLGTAKISWFSEVGSQRGTNDSLSRQHFGLLEKWTHEGIEMFLKIMILEHLDYNRYGM